MILTGNAKSTSHIYKTKVVGKYATMYMSKEGKDLKTKYYYEALSQGVEKKDGPIEMKMKFYFGDKRKRDVDNFNKLILDSLSGVAYEDDSQIQKLTLEKGYDKDNPRIEIKILELK